MKKISFIISYPFLKLSLGKGWDFSGNLADQRMGYREAFFEMVEKVY